MNKFLIILIFITSSAFAKNVTVIGTHEYSEDISTKKGCEWAKKDALIKAEQEFEGKKFLSEETEMCNEVKGKTRCVRNKLFLSESSALITNINEINKEVVLIGKQGGKSIRVEEISNWADTIPYEILTNLNERIPRVYINWQKLEKIKL